MFKRSCLLLLIIAFVLFILSPIILSADDATVYLLKGKDSLDMNNYESAISQLTTAYERLPILGDYALFWRAKAFEAKNELDKAVNDLITIKEKYKDSPLIKNVRIKEIELIQKKNGNVIELYEALIKDYPTEYSVKYSYALYLKENNEKEKAKRIFKDLYISVTPFSKQALNEISESDLTIEDIISRCKNLNNAWLFKDSERCFKEVIAKKIKPEIKKEAIEGYAYSLFRQKRYKEASDLYNQINDHYWLGRSLLRARDIISFEKKIPLFISSGDKRFSSLFIAYGTIKRREGDIKNALNIFNDVISKYPSEKENSLWEIGWTYYLSEDYKQAHMIFQRLYEMNRNTKYLYWKNKCEEMLGESKSISIAKKEITHRDFYSLLSTIGEGINKIFDEKREIFIEDSNTKWQIDETLGERIRILDILGFKNEVLLELMHLSKKVEETNKLIAISSYLKRLGKYKLSINLVSKIPYNEEIKGLFYPVAYAQEVQEAARKFNIDPFFILAIMREESRFDSEARSIAGAKGLLQLMPETASRLSKELSIKIKNPDDLYEPKTNILIGSYYLKKLLEEFQSLPAAIAAYNAGENAVREWLKNGRYKSSDEFIEDIPFNETKNYVKKVLMSYFEYTRDILSSPKHSMPLPDWSVLKVS